MSLFNEHDSSIIFNTVNGFTVILTSCLILTSVADASCVGQETNKGKDVIFSTPPECIRRCVEGKKPKTCYYQFHLESYTTMGRACNFCTPNITNQLRASCQCVPADGVERTALTVNRMMPGPSIQVCQGDRIVVDVTNEMNAIETTIHWHGVFQMGTQYYDGVPFVTQCPIAQGNTFRYQFVAENAGTHFWHAHHGLQKMDGISGSLIIREPDSQCIHRHLYDYDRPIDAMVITDWFHQDASNLWPGFLVNHQGQAADAVLIQGLGQYTDLVAGNTTNTTLAVYKVRAGKRYRFRYISSTCTVCPFQLSIEGHRMTLIATDGVDIEPIVIDSLISVGGERYDFVLNTHKNDTPRSWWIRVQGLEECADKYVQQFAILRYKGAPRLPSTPKPAYNESFLTDTGVVANALGANCSVKNDSQLCVSELRSAVLIPPGDIEKIPDCVLTLGVGFHNESDALLWRPNTYNRFFMPRAGPGSAAFISNISYTSPPSPPISQFKDNPPGTFCSKKNLPPLTAGGYTCTNMENLPLHCVTELIVYDSLAAGVLFHGMHLHGNHFYVLGMGPNPDPVRYPLLNDTIIRMLDEQGMLSRNFNNPPAKDTIALPSGGYAILKFQANNPGYWLFHCHFDFHMLAGMEMIMHVGEEKDLPPVPPGFPKCGNFYPPISAFPEIEHDE